MVKSSFKSSAARYLSPPLARQYSVVKIMDKLTVKYRFTRINNSIAGFASSNRASTDALTALLRWKAGAPENNEKSRHWLNKLFTY